MINAVSGQARAARDAPAWAAEKNSAQLSTAASPRASPVWSKWRGSEAFVTGPLMRLGRAAAHWDDLACAPYEWQAMAAELLTHSRSHDTPMRLSIYPWDILCELQRRLESPQAMLLIVPNGQVKLLNALPFAVADLRYDTLATAWRRYLDAWRSSEVSAFITACQTQPALLLHANETWASPFPSPRHDR